MEFTIERERFLGGVQKTLGVVERQSGMPILQNLLIRTTDAGIEIAATDREIGILTDYEASVIETGGITIPARKLFETLRELQGETVHLRIGDAGGGLPVAVLTSNKSVCKLHGLSPADYPDPPVRDSAAFFAVSGALLYKMIRQVSFAVSRDELKRNLSGVFLGMGEASSSIRMIACDGHRLASVESVITDPGISIPEKGVIIPRKGILEIRKIAEAEEGDVRIGFAKGACVVETGHTVLRVGLIDGEFPDWRRVVPDESAILLQASVDRDAVLRSLRLMAVYCPESVVMDFRPEAIYMDAVNPDVGEIRDEVPAEYGHEYGQEAERIAKFNVRYLLDAIEAAGDSRVIFNVPEATRGACLIRGAEGRDYFCIVMPLVN